MTYFRDIPYHHSTLLCFSIVSMPQLVVSLKHRRVHSQVKSWVCLVPVCLPSTSTEKWVVMFSVLCDSVSLFWSLFQWCTTTQEEGSPSRWKDQVGRTSPGRTNQEGLVRKDGRHFGTLRLPTFLLLVGQEEQEQLACSVCLWMLMEGCLTR